MIETKTPKRNTLCILTEYIIVLWLIFSKRRTMFDDIELKKLSVVELQDLAGTNPPNVYIII